MALRWDDKDPEEILDYSFDWSKTLEDGESISTSSWTVETGASELSSGIDGETTTVWIGGGSDGAQYDVTNQVQTSQGRIYERTSILVVRQR